MVLGKPSVKSLNCDRSRRLSGPVAPDGAVPLVGGTTLIGLTEKDWASSVMPGCPGIRWVLLPPSSRPLRAEGGHPCSLSSLRLS